MQVVRYDRRRLGNRGTTRCYYFLDDEIVIVRENSDVPGESYRCVTYPEILKQARSVAEAISQGRPPMETVFSFSKVASFQVSADIVRSIVKKTKEQKSLEDRLKRGLKRFDG